MNITHPIRYRARLTPDATAIIETDDTRLSYADMDRCIDGMIPHLRRLGVRAGDIVRVGIQPPHQAVGLMLVLAVMRMGATAAEPSLPDEAGRPTLMPAGIAPPGTIAYDRSWMILADPVLIGDTAAPARIFASSGTTGTPKHAPVGHATLLRRIARRSLLLPHGGATRMIGVGLGGALGFETTMRTLCNGGTIVLFDPARAVEAMLRHQVAALTCSPVMLRMFAEQRPPLAGPVPTLRVIEFGGGPLSRPLYDATVDRLCPRLLTQFGCTEASMIACGPTGDLIDRQGAVGFPAPGLQTRFVDEAGAVLAPGVDGLLELRGETVVTSYVAGIDGRFHDGWFRTGDIGRLDPDGVMVLLGRDVEVLNVGGVKISPWVLEDALRALDGVTDAAVFTVPDPAGMAEVWAAIVADPPVDDATLDAFRDRVGYTLAPAVVLHLREIPRDGMGKIQRDRLLAAARDLLAGSASEVPAD